MFSKLNRFYVLVDKVESQDCFVLRTLYYFERDWIRCRNKRGFGVKCTPDRTCGTVETNCNLAGVLQFVATAEVLSEKPGLHA